MNKILSMPPVDRLDPQGIPPLESGDRLTREEFERRYNAMPTLKKAELIEGVVYMASAVRFAQHGVPHFDLIGWLALYRMATPGIQGADNSTLRLSLLNEPQPDAALLILPAHGGRVQIDPDDYITGGPELLGEVAASSASYDLHDKLEAYRRNGVLEYVVWRVYDRAIDWFVLRHGQFVPLPLTPDGLYQSEVFPGLWLDPAALIQGDMARVMQVLQQGIASPEHAAFRARLHQAAAPNQP